MAKTTGSIDKALDNLEQMRVRDAPDCANTWCDNPGPITHYKWHGAEGFPVCKECKKILSQ